MTAATLPISRPPLALFGSELWRAGMEFLSHHLDRPVVERSGDGHPVIIFPGLATDGHAVAPLRDHCKSLGYAAVDWGRGINTGARGDPSRWLQALARDVDAMIEPLGMQATLIGWSLGGVFAREVAKLIPSRIRQVITIATPFNADHDHTNVGWLLRILGGGKHDFDAEVSRALRTPPPVPTTSIYSRTDGVVAWQTCMHDGAFPHVEDVEVRGSHVGMVWNREVLRLVEGRLRRSTGAVDRKRIGVGLDDHAQAAHASTVGRRHSVS